MHVHARAYSALLNDNGNANANANANETIYTLSFEREPHVHTRGDSLGVVNC